MLTACKDEPTSEEVEQAILSTFGTEVRAMANVFGQVPDFKFLSIAKVGCQPDGRLAFRCDVAIEYETGKPAARKAAEFPVRVVKGSAGWSATGWQLQERVGKLTNLKKLLDSGALTRAEFEEEKGKVLKESW